MNFFIVLVSVFVTYWEIYFTNFNIKGSIPKTHKTQNKETHFNFFDYRSIFLN